MRPKQSELYKFLICIFDILSVFLSIVLVGVLPNDDDLFSMTALTFALIHIATYYTSHFIERFDRKRFGTEIKAIVIYTVQYFLFTTMMLFLDKTMSLESRTKLVYFVMVHALILFVWHYILKKIRKHYFKHAKNLKKVMLITTFDRLDTVVHRMQKTDDWDGTISSVLLVDVVDRSNVKLPDYFAGASRVDMVTLDNFITRQVVDEAFIYLDAEYDLLVGELIPLFEESGIDVSVNITAFDISVEADRKLEQLSGFTVIKFSTKFYSYYGILMKRLIDILAAIVGLVITIPIAIVLIPLIKLDSKGPAIFAQERVGKNGRIFKFYKFRSMVVDAEARKAALMAENEMEGGMFKMEHDPRITRVGKFIRKTSLDELPQFFNVLIGDMSLIGTRPPTVEEYHQYTHKQKKRLSLKPGITGMWQVSGRSDIKNFEEVVKLDVEYIDNWSLWLDIKIILKTIKIVILGSGAR
ncbi:sugar transferase [Carnobacteriaceae bacterium zg-ZUI252]|nr:sugar transferase [Carnobacteriaceae bacterium zg-ZUI252]MBS4769734.1 sugar transferase [Carnobacteriaceae bacterium zg-ZUI240]QTU83144.1 sugar transferase [Carnobacteriaceae bacterium zg-C25]